MEDPEITQLVGDAPHIRLDEIPRHPRFEQARRLYLERFLAVYGGDPFLVRLLIESSRFVVFVLSIILDAGQEPDKRETWFTIGRLKQLMSMFKLASERQVDHLVARLREVGYLDSTPAPLDGRMRLLRPTEMMRAHDRDWLAAHYAPLTVLCPQNDYSAVMHLDPAFQVAQRRASIPFMPLGYKLLMAVPEMTVFFDKAAGHMVIAALLRTALDEGGVPTHAAIPYADVGDRFGVSRTHVRQILVAAQEMGLVKLHARGGHKVEILPRLWDCHARGIAGGMYLHDLVHAKVTNRMRAH